MSAISCCVSLCLNSKMYIATGSTSSLLTKSNTGGNTYFFIFSTISIIESPTSSLLLFLSRESSIAALIPSEDKTKYFLRFFSSMNGIATTASLIIFDVATCPNLCASSEKPQRSFKDLSSVLPEMCLL